MTATAGIATGDLERPAPRPALSRRIIGLDGIRGLAALFVVVHHCFLASFPGYPRMTGPWWAGWMIYGHLAVVVFIVLSGFSLAIGPARHGWHLDGLGKYAHRRAWRILSAYWPALVFSFVMAWVFVPQPGEGTPTARSAVVYGLLIQDVTGAPSPNGAFWSIAIEAQLYILLPLLLLLVRRSGFALMLLAVTVPVLVIGTFAPSVPVIDLFTRFTPQLAVGFTMGVVAAGVAKDERWHRLPLLWLSVAAAVPAVALIAVMGSVWTVEHYFWVDLAVLPAIALLLAAIGAGRAPRVSRAVDVAPIRSLGGFSYSLYLIHAPIVVAVATLVVRPRMGTGVSTLLVMLALAVPLALVAARLFAALFDLPFQRHKSWSALLTAARARLRRGPGGRSHEIAIREGEGTSVP
ncbi:MAG TPA: acyltransferase [Nocardioides sp.]|uniref:acyltransferase family protein n=1 Tax=Nocardioides sp. TaxID=35761 RepID=UPI002E2F75B5|nr:acyltransferase [Nocardioides sp.]HEX5089027.1 acyltransferase [Nocardioides sp.]